MEKAIAITAKNISKHYPIQTGNNDSFLKSISGKLVFNAQTETEKKRSNFICLNNINFEIQQGEIIGIIGKNGSGKSTLLKIISEVTAPTTGEIEIFGKLSSILEVSMGLHPELTGRENIFMSGTLLGLSKAQIKEKIQAIIDYSDIEKFIDVPVKKYSSGMSTRLAFAVAAFLESDILLLDEALAMGDSAFRTKCLKKIEELIKSGKTIVLVTHDLHEIFKYCNRVMYLRNGEIVSFGDPLAVISEYLQYTFAGKTDSALSEAISTNIKHWDAMETAPGNEDIKIRKISVCAQSKGINDFILTSDSIKIEIEYWKNTSSFPINFGIIIHHYENKLMGIGTNHCVEETQKYNAKGIYKASCIIPANLLNDSLFTIDFAVLENLNHIILRIPGLISFKVYPDKKQIESMSKSSKANLDILSFKGPLTPIFEWKFEKANELPDI